MEVNHWFPTAPANTVYVVFAAVKIVLLVELKYILAISVTIKCKQDVFVRMP